MVKKIGIPVIYIVIGIFIGYLLFHEGDVYPKNATISKENTILGISKQDMLNLSNPSSGSRDVEEQMSYIDDYPERYLPIEKGEKVIVLRKPSIKDEGYVKVKYADKIWYVYGDCIEIE